MLGLRLIWLLFTTSGFLWVSWVRLHQDLRIFGLLILMEVGFENFFVNLGQWQDHLFFCEICCGMLPAFGKIIRISLVL